MPEKNVERVREVYGLIRRGNPRRLLELIAPGATWRGVEGTRWAPCEDGQQVASTLLWRGTVHRFRITEAIAVGDRVVLGVVGRRMNRLGAPWWGWRIFQVVTVSDGKIAAIQDYARRRDALAAVGLQPR